MVGKGSNWLDDLVVKLKTQRVSLDVILKDEGFLLRLQQRGVKDSYHVMARIVEEYVLHALRQVGFELDSDLPKEREKYLLHHSKSEGDIGVYQRVGTNGEGEKDTVKYDFIGYWEGNPLGVEVKAGEIRKADKRLRQKIVNAFRFGEMFYDSPDFGMLYCADFSVKNNGNIAAQLEQRYHGLRCYDLGRMKESLQRTLSSLELSSSGVTQKKRRR